MLGFFASNESKMRRNAANWLEVADKVWALRRDVLPAGEAQELGRRREELRQGLKARADAAKLKLQIESLEAALQRSGGAVYPKTTLVDNIEFLLVAAIVILGVRTYFIQPFKIPTNSMWPSYYGMTAENLPAGRPVPGPAARVLRLLTLGAIRHEAAAPADGQVSMLIDPIQPEIFPFARKRGRSWLIFPTDLREYTFFVDGEPTTVDVPMDFGQGPNEHAGSFEDLVVDTYFGGWAGFRDYVHAYYQQHRFEEREYTADLTTGQPATAYVLPLGKTVRKGEPVLRFDILTGDQLFVDRFTYHFLPPKPGQGFVFRTDNIPDIGKEDYYIKRLVGVPGDTITIHPPLLYRNGSPITGARAFYLNQHQVPPYAGYSNPPAKFLTTGGTLTVPEHKYFAMGDNSYNSSDGRFWGFVDGADVIGRPLFVYYPFTSRWGFAH